MNIFVAKLDYDSTSASVQDMFEQYGTVDSVKIIMDKMTGRSKGYGFVEMPDDDEALSAISALNNSNFEGRTIVVKKAEPRDNRGGGGGGRGGFNRGGGGDRRGGGNHGGGYRRY